MIVSLNVLRALGFALATAALLVCSAPLPAVARPSPRTAVMETPVLFGRPVARFILETPIATTSALYDVEILPGTFVPTIQDSEGVFYEAVNGIKVVSDHVQGGLYVSKLKPGHIVFYLGKARGAGLHVQISRKPLPFEAVKKLKIGKAVGKS